MALRLPFVGTPSRNGRNNGSNPISETPDLPTDQVLGRTAPYQDPGTVRPQADAKPIGASGRANFYGLPQWDELNPDLTGVQGMRRLDDMYWTDPHIRRLVLAAWSPLVAGTWALEPYGGEEATQADKDIADAIWWMLTEWMSPNFTEHLYEVGPALLRFGFVPFEQQWRTCTYQGKTLLGPKKLGFMLPRTLWQWWQDEYGELTHVGQILPNRANVIVPATELTYYRLSFEGDNWMGRSLLRHAYKPWLIKDRLERIQMVGCERSAKGVPVVYHSPDIDEGTRQKLEQILANMHVSEAGYMILPGWKMGEAPADADPAKQFLVDVIQYNSASDDAITKAIEYHQTAISSSFLTDFLELGHHQVGARATADVQEDPFLTAINAALLPPVIPPLNRLVDRIRKLNWGSADGSPKLKLTLHDEASLSEISTYVQQCVAAGAMQVDPDLEDWLRERGSLPVANAVFRAKKQAMDDANNEANLASAKARAADPMGVSKVTDPKNPNAGDPEPPNPDKPPSAKTTPTTTPTNTPKKQLDQPDPPVAAGLIVHAADTGRVLMIQRSDDKHDDDDTRARWEFPGGKLDDGESTWDGGHREWTEETGAKLPLAAKRIGSFTSPDGKYQAFGVRVPRETDLSLSPQNDEVADAGWWHPADLATDHRVRGKVQQALPDVHRLLGTAPKALDAPFPPPGLDVAKDPARRCATCKMFDPARSVCMGYNNLDVQADWWCRSWKQGANPKSPAGTTTLDQPGQIHADVAVDFDGVLHPNTPDEKPLTEGPIVGAVDGLTALAARYRVVVFTARTDLDPVRTWLVSHGFPRLLVTHEKPIARYYIDDHNWPSGFPGWDQVEQKLLEAGFAPMSGGVSGESGLQMVPEVGDAKPKRRRKRKTDDDEPGDDSPDGEPSLSRGAPPDEGGDRRRDDAPRSLDASAEPTAKWFERLLSQDRLREAFDGARDHIEAAVGPHALLAARKLATQAVNGVDVSKFDPPPELTDALTSHYQDMYRLGHATVQDELAKQRRALGTQLDTTTDAPTGEQIAEGAAGVQRLRRARQRGEHSARQIVNRVTEVLGRAQITGLKDPAALQTAAEQAATGQLRMEAVMNAAPSINDGRNDAALSASDIAGAYYTSVLDERTCGECEKADDGVLMSPDEAVALGPPNPNCAGSDRCRCMLVWVLSGDPAALAAAVG